MTHKIAQTIGSKPAKGTSNVVLSKTSSSKSQLEPDVLSKPDSHLPGSPGAVSTEKRQLMIAEAAYFISERRGFTAGCEMEDWLLAEKQVDAVISGGGAQAA